jgi:hypothetical protein
MTLQQLASDIIARPAHYAVNSFYNARDWEIEAQWYLDNLAEGGDYPEELIKMLARDEAADDMPNAWPERDEAGYSWSEGPYSEDEWMREELPAYIASVRSTYGMVSA